MVALRSGLTVQLLVGVTLAMTACASAAPEGPTQTTETASATPADTAEAAAADTPATSAPSAASSAPAKDTRVRDACHKLCERVTGSCPKGRGEACLAQCAQHEARSTGCETQRVAAFECQLKAADAFCNNVVSTGCTDAFANMQR